ncbi:hypothetical protein Hamer_G003438, partial [Homarus americanus]
NTGRHTGACKLIEIKLEKNRLWLPCRHHVHEVVIGGVFDRVMGPSTGPDILVFKRFQAFWPNIVQSDYSTAATDQEMDLVPQDVNDIHLEDFVSSATSKFFDMLNLPTDFLQLSPSLWQTNAGYCKAQKKLKTMKVVNDVAERGVALIQDYIHVITKDEEQRQFLLQVVSDHRKNFPNSLKRTVIEALKKNDLCC